MGAQETFNKAIAEYKDLTAIIKSMAGALAKSVKGYSVEIALRQFDRILQCILLRIALADREFTSLQKQFIEKITDRGDILGYLKNKYDVTFTWDNLYHIKESEVVKFLKLIDDDIESFSKDFVLGIATVDAMTEHNYFDDIMHGIVEIISYCATIDDGEFDKREQRVSQDAFFEYLGNQYISVKASVVKQLNNKSSKT